ncbi:non-histone chromosomal protein HMG-14-like [Elephas maximus indicus]|uniref:non-histone chromosomal protein HMG-14-like n=1 Tax=Elephas maximus indicus TaxID=99487 RepID=UPI0021170920|nr:non-histone chromosomal protein HMG-14-like [Elephas maximus indicus]
MPKKKVRSAQGVVKEEPKKRSARLLTKSTPAKVETKPKKAAAKDKSSGQKMQTKSKRGAKGKQTKVTNQETKEDLPAENREIKNEESPASEEAGEKPHLTNIIFHVLSVVPPQVPAVREMHISRTEPPVQSGWLQPGVQRPEFFSSLLRA